MTKLKAYRVTYKTGRWSEKSIIVVAPNSQNIEALVSEYYKSTSGWDNGPDEITKIELLGEAIVD